MENKKLKIIRLFLVLVIFVTKFAYGYKENDDNLDDFRVVNGIKSLYLLPKKINIHNPIKCNGFSKVAYKIYNLNFNICIEDNLEIERISGDKFNNNNNSENEQVEKDIFKIKADNLSFLVMKKPNIHRLINTSKNISINYDFMLTAFNLTPDALLKGKEGGVNYTKDQILFKFSYIPDETKVIYKFKIANGRYKGFIAVGESGKGLYFIYVFDRMNNWYQLNVSNNDENSLLKIESLIGNLE